MREEIIQTEMVPGLQPSGLNLRAGKNGKHGVAGYTMMEVALIVAIVLCLLAFAIPSLFGAVATYKLNAAVDSASWAIQTTRYQAIMKGYPYQLTFNTTTKSYQVSSQPPGSASFSNVGGAVPVSGDPVTISANASLQFKPNGIVIPVVAGSQTFSISFQNRTKTITVTNYGSVTVQ